MSKSRRAFIAKEGRGYILTLLGAGITAAFLSYFLLSAALVSTGAVLMFLFRGTERNIPPSPLAVVSPVDGVVTHIQACHDRYLDREAIRIDIKPNIFGEYVIRGPSEGKINDYWIRKRGKEMKVLAREYSYWVQTDEKDDVVLVLRPIFLLKPIWYIPVGQRVGQGQKCGFLSFGGKVEVLIPANSRVNVSMGDKVQSGSEILAALTHE